MNGGGIGRKHKEQRKASVDMEPWSARRNAILSKYTTSEKLSIVTSFLSEGEKGECEPVFVFAREVVTTAT